jgi:hypothetical protein
LLCFTGGVLGSCGSVSCESRSVRLAEVTSGPRQPGFRLGDELAARIGYLESFDFGRLCRFNTGSSPVRSDPPDKRGIYL